MAAEPRSAVRRALAEYLRGELGALYSAMTVFDEWPHGQALPDLAVSITVPDVAPELREFPPMVVDFAPGAADTTSTATYSFGVASIGLQLDLWTGFPAARDEVVGELQKLLNRPVRTTLGTAGLPGFGMAADLVLRVPDFCNCLCNFSFGHFPRMPEDSETAQTGRWRASWTGRAELHLLNQEAVAILRHLQLSMSLAGGARSTSTLF